MVGPRGPDGKHCQVGVTLRCEPTEPHDLNAIRAEVMGQHVGYVSRGAAKLLSPAMQAMCGGVGEAQGVIVGGWDDGETQGDYGVRVWVATSWWGRLFLAPELVRRR
jgi:hypothetical protein